MPFHSKEVVTLRLILDCDCDEGEDEDGGRSFAQPAPASQLLALPIELRLKILRHLLRFDHTRESHTRRPPEGSINQLLQLDNRRILEAPQFRHKGKQEINGVLPLINTCQINTAIMRVCKGIYWEAKSVLYEENRVLAIQTGIKGLGAKMRNYGVPVFGPLQPRRLTDQKSSENDTDSHDSKSTCKALSGVSGTKATTSSLTEGIFDPVILIKGQKLKPETVFYICCYKDAADFLHALWIIVKSPFARGMRFSVHLTSSPKFRLLSSSDRFVRHTILPWMHNYINSITCNDASPERVDTLAQKLQRHKDASTAEPNVYTYNVICAYLEQVMQSAEKSVEKASYLKAEKVFERVCYEACSIVRTRTGKLVDVSTKTKEGINRVCKLIAISSFRLCELRSGAIADSQVLRTPPAISQMVKTEAETNDQPNESSSSSDPEPFEKRVSMSHHGNKHEKPSSLSRSPHPTTSRESKSKKIKTTRLEGQLARDLAIMSGMLALRLPCATPLPEWTVRLNIMLLRLFAEQGDTSQARSCVRRLHQNYNVLLKEAKAKNKSGGKWSDLETLVTELNGQLDDHGGKKPFVKTAERCQELVRKLWGDRLMPKKGYIGLIWTFRWA